MTTPPPLRQRPLLPGRGRVYLGLRATPGPVWAVDYRASSGTLYGAYAMEIAEAHDWIRTKAKEAQK